jgi:dihydroflavonol-4-reductase
MRILITGATGLVGNNCLRLLDNGLHELHVLVRANHDPRPLEGLDMNRHFGDLNEPSKLERAIPEVDVIIHAAADTHIGKRPRPMQHTVNVEATGTIACVARKRGAKLVFVSSVDALPAGSPTRLVDEETAGNAKFPCGYVATKREAEQVVFKEVENGLDAVIVNPGFMLGPWDWKPSSGRMLLQVATRLTPFGPKGGFSVCDIRDVSVAICKIATSDTQCRRYILAGNNIRYIDTWRIFAKVAGSSPPICAAGPLMRILAGKWGDTISSLTGREGDVNSAAIGMSNLFHFYDSSRAQHELDYRIRPTEESVEAAWDWFTQYGYV